MTVQLAKLRLIVLAIAALCQVSMQASTPTDPEYVASVAEVWPSSNGTAAERVAENLENYMYLLRSNENLESDIFVFPESTLNNVAVPFFVPSPEENVAPCDDTNATYYHEAMVAISCRARNVSVYIVINVSEKENCTLVTDDPRPCASSGLNIYNTNVVFDRNGVVISRYRKWHLYGEDKNVTLNPEYGIFDTDFGVRFGHFICFDILFYTPAQEMVDKLGVRDFIFPSMWFSQLPFLTGLQFQFAWSYANNINLLASAANNMDTGNTGSGIYSGRLSSTMTFGGAVGGGLTSMTTSRVRKQPAVRRLSNREIAVKTSSITQRLYGADDWFLKRDFLENYHTEILDLSNGTSLQRDLCWHNSSFCCHFDLSWGPIIYIPPSNDTKYYSYRLGVFDGWREDSEDAADLHHIKNCAIFTCIGPNIADCGKLYPSADKDSLKPQFTFQKMAIEVSFPHSKQMLLMPNTLLDNMFPMTQALFNWTETIEGSKTHKVRFELKGQRGDILTFAAYGNYFDGVDDTNDADDGAATVAVSAVLMLMSFLLTWFGN